MSRTIVQDIGPLYGEANTGSVWGQPNGSYALGQGPAPIVPPVVYSLSISHPVHNGEEYDYIKIYGTGYVGCDSTGAKFLNRMVKVTTDISDLSVHLEYDVATDSAFTTIIGHYVASNGDFGGAGSVTGDTAIVAGNTYYVRAIAYAADASVIATADTIMFTGYSS